jgi:uncharacterized membrane protein
MDNDQDKPEEGEKASSTADCRARRRRLLAALSYFGALFVIPLVLGEKDEFVRFHVHQGAVMCVAEIIACAVGWVPVIGWSVAAVVWVAAIIAFIRTLDGKKWEIPVIIDYAKRLKF